MRSFYHLPKLDAHTCIRDMTEADRLYGTQSSTPIGVYVVLAECYRMVGRDSDNDAACEKANRIAPITAIDRLDAADRKRTCGK